MPEYKRTILDRLCKYDNIILCTHVKIWPAESGLTAMFMQATTTPSINGGVQVWRDAQIYVEQIIGHSMPPCAARFVAAGEAPLAREVRPEGVGVAGPPFGSLPPAVGWAGPAKAVIPQLPGLQGP